MAVWKEKKKKNGLMLKLAEKETFSALLYSVWQQFAPQLNKNEVN